MKELQTKERFIELRGHGLPLAKIAAEINVSKTTLINWERDFREEIDNLQAAELEAMCDKYCLSVRKRVEFFGDVLNRIQRELETRDLSSIPTEKLFAMYAHFHQEAQRALPVITFKNEEEVQASKSQRLALAALAKNSFKTSGL
jgi:transcriptional regulator with XRE-family HTH domain